MKQLLALFRGRNKIQCFNDSFPVTSVVSKTRCQQSTCSVHRQVGQSYWHLALVICCGRLPPCPTSHQTQNRKRNMCEHISEFSSGFRDWPLHLLYLLHRKEAYLSAGINGHRDQQSLTVANGRCSVLAGLRSLLSQLCRVVREK